MINRKKAAIMENMQRIGFLLTAGICMLLCLHCEENPLDHSVISPIGRQISGQATLVGETNHENIYVWLEGFNIGTYTDEMGEFQIFLPSPDSQGIAGRVNGIFYLYFYIANYRVSMAQVMFADGELITSSGDFRADGKLNGVRALYKLLHIRTTVIPETVPENFEGDINVLVQLQAVSDSVNVVFPKITGGSSGVVFLRNISSEDVFVYLPESVENIQMSEKIGPEIRYIPLVFRVRRGSLPSGRYEAIPYFFVEQDTLPPELLESLDPNVGEIGPDYLNIPFRRDGGQFTVQPLQ